MQPGPKSGNDTGIVSGRFALLRPKTRIQKMAPVLAAAAFAAFCALSFATVMVLAPPAVTQHLPDDRLGGP